MKTILIITALLGALGVALGAFGAHGLEGKIQPEQISTWETAVKYQLIHVLVILILLLGKRGETMVTPAIFFMIGILLFSGSLYLLSTNTYLGIESWKSILGPITPLGGLSFIIGWLVVAYKFLQW